MTTAIAQLPCLISHPLEGPKNLEITDPFPHQSLCVFGLFLTHWKARIRSMILQIKLTANWVLLLQIKAEQANQERRVRLQVGAHRQLRDVAEHDEGLVRAQGKGVHRHEHEHFPDSCWTLWKRGMYYEQLKPSFCCLSWFFVMLLFLDKASTGRSQQSTAITAVYVFKAKAIYYTAKSTFVRAFWLISQRLGRPRPGSKPRPHSSGRRTARCAFRTQRPLAANARLGTTETTLTTATFGRSVKNGSLRFSHKAASKTTGWGIKRSTWRCELGLERHWSWAQK